MAEAEFVAGAADVGMGPSVRWRRGGLMPVRAAAASGPSGWVWANQRKSNWRPLLSNFAQYAPEEKSIRPPSDDWRPK
jgi:hypothetical protein